MKITPAVLSIPPYLSAPWATIASLHSKPAQGSYTLVVVLKTGIQTEVPGLDGASINEIFEAHARFSELSGPAVDPNVAQSMQHNPEQSDLPDMPEDVLQRMRAVAKVFGLEDTSILPTPVENCNCVFCQVVRSLGQRDREEEIITEADLHFRDWEVKQVTEKLYDVTNPLDSNELYHVFLGTPLGCTCGSKNCEHLKAVLST